MSTLIKWLGPRTEQRIHLPLATILLDALDGDSKMIEIPLTQNQVALIDDEDYELVSQYKWCARWSPGMRSYYAVTNIRKPDGKRIHLQMHRLITNAQKGEVVDHISHNTLDNRKSELRLCT